MTFRETLARVKNRGTPPPEFIAALVRWGKTAPADIFAVNAEPGDVYTSVRHVLGPYNGELHRRAVMLEILRVLAGFESSWKWTEGRDTTNSTSNRPDTEEAGAFQVSANSQLFGRDLRELVAEHIRDYDHDGDIDHDDFRAGMKLDHPLSLEYAARLLRHTTRHNGPVKRHEIDPWLSREAVEEFEAALTEDVK